MKIDKISKPKIDIFSREERDSSLAATLPFIKSPPYSQEGEQGVLGCIFLSAHECLEKAAERFKSGSAVFYDLRHQVIYETLVEMYDRKEAIDIITVMQRLKDKNQLDSVGGVGYLACLPDTVPSSVNIEFYISIVLEKFMLRQMLNHSNKTITEIYNGDTENLEQILSQFESGAMSVRDSVSTHQASSIKDAVHARINFYESCWERGGGIIGLPSGFRDIDKNTSGLQDGDVIMIAGRPSTGKTSLAMNMVENLAINNGIPVGVFSLEMTRESIVGRMIATRARVNERSIIEASLAEGELPRIITAGAAVAGAPIFIDDSSSLTISQLQAKARRMKRQHGIRALVIDYVQLLSSPKYSKNKAEEVEDISKGVKAIAKELRIPVIALAQLNRDMEKGTTRKPKMSDLRGSGQLEQDVDVLFMLYLADENAAAMNPSVVSVNALLAKQRNGIRDIDIPLTFHREYTKFVDCQVIRDEDVRR